MAVLGLVAAALLQGCEGTRGSFTHVDESERIGDIEPGQDNRSHARGW